MQDEKNKYGVPTQRFFYLQANNGLKATTQLAYNARVADKIRNEKAL